MISLPPVWEGIIFVAGSLWVLGFLATFLEGEENNVSGTLWALFTVTAAICLVAIGLVLGSFPWALKVAGFVYGLIVLAWSRTLDPEASIARDQYEEHRRGKGQ